MALPRRGTTGAVVAAARLKQATMRATTTLEVAVTGQRTITAQVQRYNALVAVAVPAATVCPHLHGIGPVGLEGVLTATSHRLLPPQQRILDRASVGVTVVGVREMAVLGL